MWFYFQIRQHILFKASEVIIYLIIRLQNKVLGKLFKKKYIIFSIAGSHQFGKQNTNKKTKKKGQNSSSYGEKITFHYVLFYFV